MSDDLFEKKESAPLPPAEVAQRPLLGIAAGVGATAAGVTIWALIAQKYQLTWMSAALAYGIASAIKYAGRARDKWYGIVGAVLALIAAIAGNLATAVFILAQRRGTPAEIWAQLDIVKAFTYLKALGGPLGLMFYGASIYIGFWYAFQHKPKNREIDI